ncbi:hypothetical protein SEPCBS119000_000470 [Sporothrix epigloea]|uniref:U3 snoRNA associated protein n=1 Tax=Sporothrix epigloea TaxID=1892477 RepID=A0ABP0D5D1_9PEZI
MPARGSPMTRSSAAKLRSKRKSNGLEETESANVSMTEAVAENAAVSAQDEPSAAKRRKLPVRAKEADEEPEAQEAEDGEENEDEDEEESDDEAPEAISNVQAAVATRQAAQKASQAAAKRAADGKRKRQEKDARLKTQGEARKARDEAAAAAAAAEAGKREEEEAAAQEARKAAVTAPVSKLLPLEFLDSDSEDEQPQKGSTAVPATAKRAASGKSAPVQPHQKRHPRDRQLGTTVYRLLSEGGPTTMAPKLGKRSRRVQQDMLTRNRVGKPVHKGFLIRR